MYLGIEIGGTKLQLGVGVGQEANLAELLIFPVEVARGAAGIREQIVGAVKELQSRHQITRIGFGFGGPINSESQVVTTSHQIRGWDDFPMGQWCREQFGLPIVLANDCDSAALAEAKFGAGKGKRTVFYVTVGTGIGGGFVIDGIVHGSGRPSASEIGHLRPGMLAESPHNTVESLASGWGISWLAKSLLDVEKRDISKLIPQSMQLARPIDDSERSQLLDRCNGDLDQLTARHVGQAAADGNTFALAVLDVALSALGWGIAQTITLLSPEVVVVGGGVSMMGDELFFQPLRRFVDLYAFGPSKGSFEICPAELGEEVVVHGAIGMAARDA